ncbi:hypothetical protein PybrP1_005974 [[Pythium] brassicae (nom. inval.)]|nr:hypothetical protein PybrP1_005974 [[Pythium] brassicae (nom. inval.)]
MLMPQRYCAATIPLEFLSTIERVEINETCERDGVTYYVLDVFRRHFDTRLPARLNNLRHQVAQKSDLATRKTPVVSSTSNSAKPEYRVERRFSEFSLLRAQVYEAATLDPQFRCAYCDEFIVYVRFKSHQPRSLAKFTTGTRSRKTMLAAFLNDFVRMAQWRQLQNRRCESHDHIPEFIAQFLMDEEERRVHEMWGAESPVSPLSMPQN